MMLNTFTTHIAVATGKGMMDIHLQQMVCLQGLSNYNNIIFKNRQHTLSVARVLKLFEDDLLLGT